MVCECAAHRASGVPVGQLGESTGEASAAARGLASWGRPWSGEGFTSLRRPSGALAAALAGLHPSVPGKVRRRRVFGAAPCTAGKLGARPHALTSPWGRNRGTKRPLGAELRCLGVQGDGNLFLTRRCVGLGLSFRSGGVRECPSSTPGLPQAPSPSGDCRNRCALGERREKIAISLF